jgi:hypothetical protein
MADQRTEHSQRRGQSGSKPGDCRRAPGSTAYPRFASQAVRLKFGAIDGKWCRQANLLSLRRLAADRRDAGSHQHSAAGDQREALIAGTAGLAF